MNIQKRKDLFSSPQIDIEKFLINANYRENSELILKIPANFKVEEIILPQDDYVEEIKTMAELYGEYARKKEFDYLSVFSSIYEAILNAHVHGNKLNSKPILFASLSSKKSLEYIICDSSEILPMHLKPFISSIRNRTICANNPISWYDFSKQEKPQENNGTGTLNIHNAMDIVKYFKSEDTQGLAIYMRKNKEK